MPERTVVDEQSLKALKYAHHESDVYGLDLELYITSQNVKSSQEIYITSLRCTPLPLDKVV